MKNASQMLVSTFGAFVGVMGIEHGLGEILQGNVAPEGVVFPSWPDSTFFQILNGEPAMSLIPNLLVSGILASLFSLVYIVCATLLVHRKHSGLALLLVSIPMLLVGGGLFPPVLGFLIGAAAVFAKYPQDWSLKHLSPGVQHRMGALWPWFFNIALVSWLVMFPGIPAMNYFFAVENTVFTLIVLAGMFVFLFLAGVTAFIRDLQVPTKPSRAGGLQR